MDGNVNTSCLTGYGAKNEACRTFKLHEFIPRLTDYKQVYIEPFFFTGAVFWNVECRSAVINDKNDNIFNFWKVIKDEASFKTFSDDLEYTWNGKAWFDDLAARTDTVGRALLFYLCSRAAFNGVQTSKYKFKLLGSHLNKDLKAWHDKLDGLYSCQIWNLDFRDVYVKLLHHHGGDAGRIRYYIYADPPYRGTEKNYQVLFTEADHLELLRLHRELKEDKNMNLYISYNDDPVVREWYADWYIKEVSWRTMDNNEAPYQELLISNHEIKRHERVVFKPLFERRGA